MPTSSSRHTLRFGPYVTPQFRYGDVVMDEVRGELADGLIPWPIGKRGRVKGTADMINVARKAGLKVVLAAGEPVNDSAPPDLK